MENLKNMYEKDGQAANEEHPLEGYGEFNPIENKYNVITAEAKSMVDPRLCPESMWKPLQSELVDLSGKMIEWHKENDGSEISKEAEAALRKLDNDRADIVIRILPKEATLDDMDAFYSKLDEAAKLKQEMSK